MCLDLIKLKREWAITERRFMEEKASLTEQLHAIKGEEPEQDSVRKLVNISLSFCIVKKRKNLYIR